MRKLGYNIIYLIQLIRYFGFTDGFGAFIKIVFRSSFIKINSKKFNNSVYIRKKNSDIHIFYQVFAELQYDITFFTPFKPARMIDCGANVGYGTLYFNTVFPGVEVVSVEPETENYNMLCRNVANYKNVTPMHAAIWHKSAGMSIKNPAEFAAGFEVAESSDNSGFAIKGVTINEILKSRNWDYADIIKIDIEGAEFELFANNPHEWLAKTRCLVIELHDNLKPGVSQLFFKEMAHYNWITYIRGENIICFRADWASLK